MADFFSPHGAEKPLVLDKLNPHFNMDLSSSMGFPGVLPDWTNLDVLHRKVLAPRAHFYPYADEDAALSFDRDRAELLSLNGTWKFHYDPSPFEAPLWETANLTDWDDIEVPGLWQRQGYGFPHYTNIDYPFSVTPPNVSYLNPTGSYWREFDLPPDWDADDQQQIRLRFEGVDSAFHVWVNGHEVGYSQGARNPSEFDISDYLLGPADGPNSVAARVYQWSDGSYIEDQDQWWMSGIFRDVYLVSFPTSSVVDYSVTSELDDSFESGTVRVNVTIQGDIGQHDLQVKLLSSDGRTLDEWSGSPSNVYEHELDGEDLHLWSAETPYLYTVLLSFNGRVISQKVGLRRVEIRGSNFYINGNPIILYGVNRHEHHPESGRTVPYAFMRDDLLLMKRSNVNALRTAHQPHHPDVYDVADELGLYVIAEADLECHGFGPLEDSDEASARWTSDNPAWTDAYVDRMRQVVERYKNHASIIIWSLGNECFYGRNLHAMAEWVRANEPSRIIHYEPDREAASTDMYSQMYSSPDDVRTFIATHDDKPFILCEYAHAMGNGPGGLKDYVELFRSEPLVQGGLVWEWSNHGLLKREGDLEFYAYGGDFGDEPNDADFIMDGLLLSDHTPMPSLAQYAKIIQPVTVSLAGANDDAHGGGGNETVTGPSPRQMTVTNHYDFSDLGALDASWYLVRDGEADSDPRPLELPDLPAGENRTVDLPFSAADLGISREAWLTIEFRLKDDTLWAKKGHLVAWDQLHIQGSSSSSPAAAMRGALQCQRKKQGEKQKEKRSRSPLHKVMPRQDELQAEQNRTHLTVNAGSTGSVFDFDLLRGNVSWQVNGTDVFLRGPELYFYRAQTQNDEASDGDGPLWEEARVGSMYTQVRNATWRRPEAVGEDGESGSGNSNSSDMLEVSYNVWVGPKALEWGVAASLTYTLSTDAPETLRVHAQGEFVGNNTPRVVPRIGLVAVLSGEMNEAEWFGRGPGESYKDSKEAARFGTHASNVSGLFTYYDYPQENGNREDVRWLRIGTSGSGSGSGDGSDGEIRPAPLTLDARRAETAAASGNSNASAGADFFSFTAQRYMPFDLNDAKHPHDLKPLNVTVLHLDYDSNGLGSATVAQRPFEQYRCYTEPFDFAFDLSIV